MDESAAFECTTMRRLQTRWLICPVDARSQGEARVYDRQSIRDPDSMRQEARYGGCRRVIGAWHEALAPCVPCGTVSPLPFGARLPSLTPGTLISFGPLEETDGSWVAA